MKRGLVFTLCAMAAVATATVGRAQTIDLSLNLRYNDPFDPSEGGVWYLTAKTTGGSPNAGIAGVSAYLSNINPVAFHGSSVVLGAGQNPAHGAYPVVGQATINNLSSGANPYNGPVSGAHNVVYGQDIAVGAPSPIIGGIGSGAGAGNVALDPLKNAAFNNYAVLLSGTFGGTRPAFAALSGGTITDGNVLANTTLGTAAIDAAIAAGNLKVRGDSERTKGLNTPAGAGLHQGDANRDGVVTGADFNILAFNFGDPAPAGGFTWDQGDFNDDGVVTGADFNALAFNFGDPAPPPPAVSSVPEPTGLALVSLGALSFLGIRRRIR